MTSPTHNNFNCQITTDDGEESLIYANWLNNNELNNFEGWECYTGTYRIFIDKSLDVYNAMCHSTHMGNLNTGWDLVDKIIICPNKRCTGNTDDLMTRRYRLDKNSK